MKKNSKNIFKEIGDFFEAEPTSNQKAWGLIHDFYHLVLTHMENNGITKAALARRLNKSRSAISQMFNKTPNISIKKMVEIADAVEMEINISSPQVLPMEVHLSVEIKPAATQIYYLQGQDNILWSAGATNIDKWNYKVLPETYLSDDLVPTSGVTVIH